MYIKQDTERRKQIQMIDRSLSMLGPVEKTRPNPYLTDCVESLKDTIIASSRIPKDPDVAE